MTYKLTLEKAYSMRGADMGRRSYYPKNPRDSVRLHLNRVRLDNGGYDSGGAYWGIGTPLYCAESDDSEIRFFLRAEDRAAAKREILSRLPNATFYR
jgi:hypothetical protein